MWCYHVQPTEIEATDVIYCYHPCPKVATLGHCKYHP